MATLAALTSDDIPPGPLSEADLRERWNQQADKYNQWESLESAEQLAWAQALAIQAHRPVAALKAELEGEGPTDEDLYSLAEQFHGDPVPAMRRALELWGNPLQGASAPGENLATAPGEADIDHVEQLAAIIRKMDGNHSIGAAALAEAILLERYPCAFLVVPPATPPAPEPGEVAVGNRRSAESMQLAHESCRSFGKKNDECSDSEICWLDMLSCSHYENCDTIPAPQAGEVQA